MIRNLIVVNHDNDDVIVICKSTKARFPRVTVFYVSLWDGTDKRWYWNVYLTTNLRAEKWKHFVAHNDRGCQSRELALLEAVAFLQDVCGG